MNWRQLMCQITERRWYCCSLLQDRWLLTPSEQSNAQYKKTYERQETHYKVGDWVLVKFPQENTGRMRKLS